jgi:hypothetical protein
MENTRDGKVRKMADAARRAIEEGRLIFTARLYGPEGFNNYRAPVGNWSEAIEAIEAEGWELTNWAVSEGNAYPLFRRRNR